MSKQELKVAFTQGLDIRLVTTDFAEALSSVHYTNNTFSSRFVHFAFDNTSIEQEVRTGIKILLSCGINPNTLSFYVLVGFDSGFEDGLYRCNVLREYGIKPYVMRYKKPRQQPRGRNLNQLARWANNPKGLWRMEFDDYLESGV